MLDAASLICYCSINRGGSMMREKKPSDFAHEIALQKCVDHYVTRTLKASGLIDSQVWDTGAPSRSIYVRTKERDADVERHFLYVFEQITSAGPR
jgi:hypothetical protein